MSKETLWSHWWEWGKQPTLLYSTNENIWTTFSQKMKREEERLAWEIREKELEADRIKSETSKRELELEMFIWNFDDGLWKLKEELEHLALKSLSVTPYRTETHEIWDWERSIEVYSRYNRLIKKFVWLKWTDLWAEYHKRYKEHEWEWKLLSEKVNRLYKRIEDIKQIQKWKLTASEISETLSWTKE